MRKISILLLIWGILFVSVVSFSYAQIHKVKISEWKERIADESSRKGRDLERKPHRLTHPIFTNSPGTIVGYTWHEYQHNGAMSRMIAIDSSSGVHFNWMNAVSPGFPEDRYVDYNYLDSAGNWLGPVHLTPTNAGGGYTGIAGFLSDGREVLAFHQNHIIPGEQTEWWGILGIEKEYLGQGQFYLYDIPDSLAYVSFERCCWPRAAIDSLNNIHVVMKECYGDDPFGYTRCYLDDTTLVCEAPGIDTIRILPDTPMSYPTANLLSVFDSSETISHTVVASQMSGKVAIIYTKYGDVYYIESANCGQDWIDEGSFENIEKHNITNYSIDDTIRAYQDVAASYDYDNNLHILWTTHGYWEVPESTIVTTDACFLWHWREAGGISLVADGWKPSRPGANNRTISKMSIGVHPANNFLYAIWTQFDISDTAANGYSNGEIYASASTDGGITWDRPENLTNTQSPGCNAGECESDHWSSLAEVVNDTLHIQYINDKDAGGSVIGEGEGDWTNNLVLYLKVAAWTPVIAAFAGTPRSGYPPLSVQFTDSSTGDPVSWFWDFGDGETDTVENPVHTYTDAGYFDVKLVVSNETDTDSMVMEDYINVFAIIPPVLLWTNEDGYEQDGVSPDTGIGETLRQFRILYTESNNVPPASGFPKVNIDINGDGDFEDDNEGSFAMGPADADTIYSDGKTYYYNTTLPVTSTCQYSFSAQNELGEMATGEPTNLKSGPVVLDNTVALDLYIHASDITFSESNPDEGDTFTVYAMVHNNSDSSLYDVSVSFYDGENLLDQQLILYIPSRDSAQASTDISFGTMGFYPIKVVVDEENSFDEWNESNNWAIRPIKIGDYPVEGDIIVDASINSPVYAHTWINIPGNARYYPLEWEKVCGAKVTATIQETGQQYSTYTNNLGNFNLGFWGPDSAGSYNIKVEVTDFTLTGDTTLTLEVITQDKPDLIVDVSVSGEFKIGKNLTVTTKVSNVGGGPANSFKTELYKDGSYLYQETITQLSAGQSFYLTEQTVSFDEVGTHCIKAITDVEDTVDEFNEANNQEDTCFYVADTIVAPDLKVDYYDVSVSNTTPSPGDTIRILGQVHNLGEAVAYNVPVRFYIDSVQLGDDVSIPEIQAGQLQQVISSETWTVDFNKHLVEVVADPDNILAETNENNNMGALPLPYDLYPYYRSKCPGYWPYFFSTCNSFVDHPVTIYGSVRNRGGFDLLGEVNVQISDDLEGVLGVITVDSLMNHNQNYSMESIIHSFTQIGTHTLTCTVDYDNQYDEWNEGSDNIYSGTIFVDSLRPDLMIHSDYINPTDITPDSGDTVDIYADIYNIGQINAESIWVQFLMDDIQLGELVCIDSIPTGTENYRTIQATEPWIASCQPQNLHICKVIIDPNSLIIELDETNNEATRSIIACGAPDLVVDTIIFSGCKRDIGDPVTIYAIIKNNGKYSPDAQVSFYYYDGDFVLRPIGFTFVTVPEYGGVDSAEVLWYAVLDSTQICVEITDSDPPEYDTTNNFSCTLFRSFMRGDVNADGLINLSDVIYLANYKFKGGPEPKPELEAGDINYDGNIDLSDVIFLANYLLKSGPAPCEGFTSICSWEKL